MVHLGNYIVRVAVPEQPVEFYREFLVGQIYVELARRNNKPRAYYHFFAGNQRSDRFSEFDLLGRNAFELRIAYRAFPVISIVVRRFERISAFPAFKFKKLIVVGPVRIFFKSKKRFVELAVQYMVFI
jgi:hypothetical protein